MDYKITYKSSWNGGKYLLNGEIISKCIWCTG